MARMLVLAMTLVLAGCGGDNGRDSVFDPHQPAQFKDDERKEIAGEIDDLASGKDPDDIEGSARYADAMAKLTSRGARIEPQLIEALGSHRDWAVRMGVVEILQSVGTRQCVEAVIKAIDDTHPLVALYANKLLEAMTSHRIIPTDTGAAAPVPPVPRPATGDPLDAEEKLWATWHAANGKRLREEWAQWWKENRGTATLN
jgi:hypothetical protein